MPATQNKPAIENKITSNEQLAEELKIEKLNLKKQKYIHSYFIDNIWGADPPDMQKISNLIMGLIFHYVLLIFTVNTHGFLK